MSRFLNPTVFGGGQLKPVTPGAIPTPTPTMLNTPSNSSLTGSAVQGFTARAMPLDSRIVALGA